MVAGMERGASTGLSRSRARGHRGHRDRLAFDDPTATFVTYADVIVTALEAEGTDVGLVGHSLGG